MHLSDLILDATRRLKDAGIDNAQLDARLLISHALGLERTQLLTQGQRALSSNEVDKIDLLITRRAAHESVARIIGSREFWSLSFGLNEATLEPRPDSECLIEAVLKCAGASDKQCRILDLGTGTGCLLLSLLHEWPQATGLGIDLAPRAIEQATHNAAALHLDQRAAFRTGNWLEGITEKFDVIVSNPPYIQSNDIPSLMPEVRAHDPLLALDGGADGLGPYRLLIPQLKNFLNPGSIAAFEVGQGQAQDVAALFSANGFAGIEIHKDLGGIERCVIGYRKGLE